MAAPTLYQLTEEYLYLSHLLANEEIDEQTFNDTLDSYLRDASSEKLEAYAKLIRSLKARSKGLKEERDYLTERLKANDNKIESLNARLKDFLVASGKDFHPAGVFTVKLEGNGGVQPLTIDEAVREDPTKAEGYFKLVPTLDTEAIRKALTDGKALPFAKLEPRGKHVAIR